MLTEDDRTRMLQAVPPEATPAAAVIEALRIAQERRGWVADEDVAEVADVLGMTPAEVDDVATFYSLIFREPVGEHVIMLCDSISCWLTGYDGLLAHIRDRLGIGLGETTSDGLFTLLPSACLGACDKAPVMMVDEELHVHLDTAHIDEVLREYGWRPPLAPEGGR